MSVNLGDAKTKQLTSGRLFLLRDGDTSYIDLGNVIDHKYNPKVERAEHMKSGAGFKQVDVSLVKSITPAYEFVLDEHTPDLEKLIFMGTQGSDVVQAGGNVVAEQLTASSKQGRTYFATQVGLSAVAVKVGGVAKTLNTDYAIDLGSGAVTILNGGAINDGSTVTIDYTSAAVTTQPITTFAELRVQGTLKYLQYDQFSTVPRRTTTFTGQIHVTGWGENKLDNYNETTVMCIPLTAPAVSLRKD